MKSPLEPSAQSPKLIWLALFSTLASVLIHIYLYTVHLDSHIGVGAESICDLSKKFSCSAVVASSFSEVFGVPVAVFGALVNLTLLLMLIGFKLFSTSNKQAESSFWFSVPIVLASCIMAVISVSMMSVYCPFCILLYVLSFITFLSLWYFTGVRIFQDLFPFLISLNKFKFILIYALIFSVGWLVNSIIWQNTGIAELEKMESNSIEEWQNNPQYDFSALKAISFGSTSTDSPFVIVEFADFLCSHCQTAADVLHEFVDSHPNVKFLFFMFPLDGCEGDPRGEVGPNCRVARNVYCANELGKGSESHAWFFKNLVGVHSPSEVNEKIEQALTVFDLNKDEMQKCTKSPETDAAIKKLINAGKQAGVKGTPTIYVNGKRLSVGHRKSVLQKSYNLLGLK